MLTHVGQKSPTVAEYISILCQVCNEVFFPTNKKNKNCSTCQDIMEKVYYCLTGRGGWSKRAARSSVSHNDLVSITKKYIESLSCTYCGRDYTKSNPKSLDHIAPTSSAINNTSPNIAVCCLQCNLCKGALSLTQWIELCRLVANPLRHTSDQVST